jgi:septal ring factor EnvC (AmiA/AmiB activator)
MTGDLLNRLVRRAVVLVATLAVIGVGLATVKVAAEWRAASVPLDVAPVGMDTISSQFAAETDRAGALSEQIDTVATQIASLQGAILEAGAHVSGDAQSAEALKADLAAAKAKLTTLNAQLRAAQQRLTALNRAAARQAALNAAARSAGSGTTSDHEDDDEHEADDDD